MSEFSGIQRSNGIGLFAIGISGVGTLPGLDYRRTIISQYSASPILTQLIANMSQYFEPCANLDAFYDNIWNIVTAVGYGLDVWGRIVGVQRVLQVTEAGWLGFEEAESGDDANPWNQAPWYGGGAATSNYALSDESFRMLILAKAAANITDGSIPSINAILMSLFPAMGNCYVTDGGNMTMTYTFSQPLSPVQLAIVTNSGVLPRPTGVSVTVVQ